MTPEQMAQQVLRLGRKRGLAFRVDTDATGQPVVRVSPKDRLAQCPWIKLAIPRCKAALVHLLEAEGHGTTPAADGLVWHQTLARCDKCGACDWQPVGQTVDRAGQPMTVWGCGTCHADPPHLQRTIEDGLADARWGGPQRVVELHLPLDQSPRSLRERLTDAIAQAQVDGRLPHTPTEESTHVA